MSGLLISNTFDPKNKILTTGRYMGNSTSYVDILNITGKGYLNAIHANTTDAIYYSVRIVIDGVEKFNGPVGHGDTSFSASPIVRFETSCLVQAKADTSGYILASAMSILD